MKSRKILWRSLIVLVLLGGMTFLLNLPGAMKCHGEVDSTGNSGYSSIDKEQIFEVELAQNLD